MSFFPVSAGGTRMLPGVDVREVARLARAMTWKFAACRLPYAGAKAGLRFAGGDRAALLSAYMRALEPYREAFLTGPDMGTFPADFLDGSEDPVPLWARSHEGLGMDDLATGHGVKAAAEAALAHLGRNLEGATVAVGGVRTAAPLVAEAGGGDSQPSRILVANGRPRLHLGVRVRTSPGRLGRRR